MAEDKKDFGVLSDLAEIADKLENAYRGRETVIFELDKEEYQTTINMFREIDRKNDKFKVDISGIEFIYILNKESDE
jgi:stress response protein SCP2